MFFRKASRLRRLTTDGRKALRGSANQVTAGRVLCHKLCAHTVLRVFQTDSHHSCSGPLASSVLAARSTPWLQLYSLHRARATPPAWDTTRMASTTASDNSGHRYTWIVQGLSWIFSRVFSSCTEPPIECRHKVAAAHRDVSPQAATSGLPHRTPLHSSGRICSP